MKRTIYIGVVGLILSFVFNYAYAQEKITLSTYYPAPYGEYRKLAIGSSAGGYTAPTSPDIDLIVEGNVGIGTTAPGQKLTVQSDSIDGSVLRLEAGSTLRYLDISSEMLEGGAVRWDITDQSGSLLTIQYGNVGIGTTSPNEVLDIVSTDADLDLTSIGDQSSTIHTFRARGSIGSPTVVTSSDIYGGMDWRGYDGSAYQRAAMMQVRVDGTPGLNSMPGEIRFRTTPDGTVSLTTRMTIKNNGNVGIGTTTPNQRLHVSGGNILVEQTDTQGSLELFREDATPTDGDTIGDLVFSGRRSDGGLRPYAYIRGVSEDVTSGSEDGRLDFLIANIPVGYRTVMTLNPEGNVGIGTTSPSNAMLQVENDAPNSQVALFQNATAFTTGYNTQIHDTSGGSLTSVFAVTQGGTASSPTNTRFAVQALGTITGTYVSHTSSDIRLKKDIVTIPNALENVLALRGINFRWKDSAKDPDQKETLRMGMIGQEVEKVIPEVVRTADDEIGTKSILYDNMVALLVEAIKEQQKEIDNLEGELTELKAQLNIGQ